METARKPSRILYPKQTGSIDFSILLVVTILCAFGLVMVFSASYYYAIHTQNGDAFFYLKRQIIYMAVGYPLMLVMTRVNYRYLDRLRMMFLVVSVVLLIMVLFIGSSGETGAARLNGSKRWLRFAGVSIQPSEVAKFGLIFFMCSYMARHKDEMQSFTMGLAPMLLVIGIIAGLIFLQPNMSMAVIVAGIGMILLYLGGMDVRYMLGMGVIAIIAFIVLANAAEYRAARMTSFRNPFADPQGDGYQLVQSFYAIGSGGWFGKGLGNSYQKLLYMTYGESDFIFAIICEEFGFVGGAAVILLYGWIVYRGMRVAFLCKNRYGSLLSAGISIVFGLQVFINIAVVTGLAPTTGQPLPFISAGGSSLLVFLVAMGVLMNVSRDVSV
ncbi:MAG: putative lipid II flippase FtsW [Clostridia bacterium]|nr:putative lipid II flippase FtsW [Clostridia bacterium]